MFKTVVNSLRFKSRLIDSTKERQKDEKAKLKQLEELKQHREATDVNSCQSIAFNKEGSNFFVRRGRKKLATMVVRLRRVKSFAKTKRSTNQNELQDDDQQQQQQQTDEQKPKLVAVYHNEKNLNDQSQGGLNRNYDSDSDSDSDDAYESAEESLDDHQDQAGEAVKCYEAEEEEEDNYTGEQMPEEQCDIPTFLKTKNCDSHLIEETRRYLRERYQKNPDAFYEADYKRMLVDDWTVSRFMLRRRLDPERSAKLMEECGRFRKQHKMSEVELWEFPVEFHIAGGLFRYAQDRAGNETMYMRVKMYRRVPEISDVFKAFILCVLEQCDTANGGRGTAVVFDLSGCSTQNVDLGFLYWLLNSFRNYCPKGVSYIVVYNLPWFLSATAKLALTWLSETNRRSLRFVQGREIEEFIAPENLPDYLNGTCPIDYRAIPKGSRPSVEVCGKLGMTQEQALKIKELFKAHLPENYEASVGAAAEDTKRLVQDEDSASQVTTETTPVVGLVSTASQFLAS